MKVEGTDSFAWGQLVLFRQSLRLSFLVKAR